MLGSIFRRLRILEEFENKGKTKTQRQRNIQQAVIQSALHVAAIYVLFQQRRRVPLNENGGRAVY
jgi:hypothetical protein